MVSSKQRSHPHIPPAFPLRGTLLFECAVFISFWGGFPFSVVKGIQEQHCCAIFAGSNPKQRTDPLSPSCFDSHGLKGPWLKWMVLQYALQKPAVSLGFGWFPEKIRIPGFRMEMEGAWSFGPRGKIGELLEAPSTPKGTEHDWDIVLALTSPENIQGKGPYGFRSFYPPNRLKWMMCFWQHFSSRLSVRFGASKAHGAAECMALRCGCHRLGAPVVAGQAVLAVACFFFGKPKGSRFKQPGASLMRWARFMNQHLWTRQVALGWVRGNNQI